jgi:hypothetical protein
VFLTPSEIQRLTGKTRHSAQIRWLRARGYKIDVNGLGEPIVHVREANRKLVGGSVSREQEPDWGAMHRGA